MFGLEHKRLGQNPSDDPDHHPSQKETGVGGFKSKLSFYRTSAQRHFNMKWGQRRPGRAHMFGGEITAKFGQ